jgi:hypothetical protein
MGSRKKKDKRNQKKRRRPPRKGPRLPGFLEGARVVVPGPGETKMSEVLWAFMEPYLEHGRTEEALRKLLDLALVAWNAALLSGSQREELIQDTLSAVPPDVRGAIRAIVEEMIQRKEAYFAGYKRMILDYQLTWTPPKPYLSVISSYEQM